MSLLQLTEEHLSTSKLRYKRQSLNDPQGESGVPVVSDEYILDLAKKDLINILGLKVNSAPVHLLILLLQREAPFLLFLFSQIYINYLQYKFYSVSC